LHHNARLLHIGEVFLKSQMPRRWPAQWGCAAASRFAAKMTP